jgi:hypothetical protein
MGADLAENAYPIADVGTDVESQVTGLKELPVKGIHPTPAPDGAVVDDHRTSDPESASDHVSRYHKGILESVSVAIAVAVPSSLGGLSRSASFARP